MAFQRVETLFCEYRPAAREPHAGEAPAQGYLVAELLDLRRTHDGVQHTTGCDSTFLPGSQEGARL